MGLDVQVVLLRVVVQGVKMSDKEDEVTFPPEDAKPINTPLEAAVEEANKNLYNDADILEHTRSMVKAKLEEARDNDFKVELSYTDLRLIHDSVAIAITRTSQVNKVVDVLNQRMGQIKDFAQHIHNVASVRFTNEEN